MSKSFALTSRVNDSEFMTNYQYFILKRQDNTNRSYSRKVGADIFEGFQNGGDERIESAV